MMFDRKLALGKLFWQCCEGLATGVHDIGGSVCLVTCNIRVRRWLLHPPTGSVPGMSLMQAIEAIEAET